MGDLTIYGDVLYGEALYGGSVDTGSWYGLQEIVAEWRADVAAEVARGFVACPNDGEPLKTGPDGRLYCPWDGWRPR